MCLCSGVLCFLLCVLLADQGRKTLSDAPERPQTGRTGERVEDTRKAKREPTEAGKRCCRVTQGTGAELCQVRQDNRPRSTRSSLNDDPRCRHGDTKTIIIFIGSVKRHGENIYFFYFLICAVWSQGPEDPKG